VVNPNVQVAFVSVLATTVTTIGVIAAAIINNRRAQSTIVPIEQDHTVDDGDILERLLALIAENERKEATIVSLRKKVRVLTEEVHQLRAKLAEYENIQ